MPRKTIAGLERKLELCAKANESFQKEHQLASDAIIRQENEITELIKECQELRAKLEMRNQENRELIAWKDGVLAAMRLARVRDYCASSSRDITEKRYKGGRHGEKDYRGVGKEA